MPYLPFLRGYEYAFIGCLKGLLRVLEYAFIGAMDTYSSTLRIRIQAKEG